MTQKITQEPDRSGRSPRGTIDPAGEQSKTDLDLLFDLLNGEVAFEFVLNHFNKNGLNLDQTIQNNAGFPEKFTELFNVQNPKHVDLLLYMVKNGFLDNGTTNTIVISK